MLRLVGTVYPHDLEFKIDFLKLTFILPVALPSVCAATRLFSPRCLECSVCAPDYGKGAGNQCHRCTPSFRAGMLSILAFVAVFALVVVALLVVYLVRTVSLPRQKS